MSLCRYMDLASPPIYCVVNEFGTVRLHPDTVAEIRQEIPDWSVHMDRRTRGYQRWAEIERDIRAIAEVDWINMDDLTEF